jgi:uncharacterized alpha/beta hydrolase family protein
MSKLNVSFKTERPTGRYRSFDSSSHYIKLNKRKIGTIHPDTWQISLMVMKTDKITDDNRNCPWRWITLKRKSNSLEDAKAWIQTNISRLVENYEFHFGE